MRLVFFVFCLFCYGCTQKYADYDTLYKLSFRQKDQKDPVVTPRLIAEKKDHLSQCFSQWLFSNNAEAEKDASLPGLMQVVCPGREYLMDARVTERWWTLLVYSKSCVFIEATCPRK